MSPPRTGLRSKKQALAADVASSTTVIDVSLAGRLDPKSSAADNTQPATEIKVLPTKLTSTPTKLTRRNHRLLLRKQAHLQKYAVELPRDFRKQDTAVQATLVFAQEEAGTAVCVSDDGLLLTCAHCVAEDDSRPDPERLFWLSFASGRVVGARCVAWDDRRDLALLKVVAAQAVPTANDLASPKFPPVEIAEAGPSLRGKLVCIGHPGSKDLEAGEPDVKTGYDVLHLSTRAFRGYADGQDLQDHSEIGALQHDCWTYWGHSGAPLLNRRTGKLVGLHSCWDDETAMRRGVPLEAIRAFMEEPRMRDGV